MIPKINTFVLSFEKLQRGYSLHKVEKTDRVLNVHYVCSLSKHFFVIQLCCFVITFD